MISQILFAVVCSTALLDAQRPPAVEPAPGEIIISLPLEPSFCAPASTGLPALPSGVVQPAQPQCKMPVYPRVTGTGWVVHAGDDLQAVLNEVACGDEVVIDPGALFSGNFTTPPINCPTSPVLVRTALMALLPAGVQVLQSQASLMPTLSTPNSSSVLVFSDGASGWYFAGINFTVAPGVQNLWNLIPLSVGATTVSQLPSNITFDRVLVHGNDQMCVRGFIADAVNFTLINSQVYDFMNNGQDTQAVLAYNSPGPFLIANNYLEATGENVMFGGGGVPTIPGNIPSDITVRLNNLNKLAVWYHAGPAVGACNGSGQQQCWDIKNNFECKDCQRMLVDSNVMSYAVTQGQGECVILNANGASNQYNAIDVTITNNLCQHSGGGFTVNGLSATATRILWRNNLMTDISAAWGNVKGGCMEVSGPTQNVTIDHNTCVNIGSGGAGNQAAFVDPPPSTNTGFSYTNNIGGGPLSANSDNPLMVLQNFPATGTNVSYDVLVGDSWPQGCVGCNPEGGAYPAASHLWEATSTTTPTGNTAPCNYPAGSTAACIPLDWALVGFTDFPGGSVGMDVPGLALTAASPYYHAASDGADVGANVVAVMAATAGVAGPRQN